MESLEGSVYKIGIIEANTHFLWMTMDSSKEVDGVLDQWLKYTISWIKVHHGLKRFKVQTDKGVFKSKACKDLVAASGAYLLQTGRTHMR